MTHTVLPERRRLVILAVMALGFLAMLYEAEARSCMSRIMLDLYLPPETPAHVAARIRRNVALEECGHWAWPLSAYL